MSHKDAQKAQKQKVSPQSPATTTAEVLRWNGKAALKSRTDLVVLEGAGGAYRWPRDLLHDPWSEAELLVRLFRLLEPHGRPPEVGDRESRMEPLVLLADDDPELIALVDRKSVV